MTILHDLYLQTGSCQVTVGLDCACYSYVIRSTGLQADLVAWGVRGFACRRDLFGQVEFLVLPHSTSCQPVPGKLPIALA